MNRMKMTYVKIAKRLRLAEWFYRVESLVCSICTSSAKQFPGGVSSALRLLHSYSPDPGSSCICQHDFAAADSDVEVIVPCYNVELYVSQCLDSILSQKTEYSFFVTIVNDGSTDSTRSLIAKYEHLPNVRVIDQSNKGFSGARNAGIRQAHGRYLMFVDSDDVLMPGAIDCLMRMAEKTGADMVDGGFRRFADRDGDFSAIPGLASLYDMIQHDNLLPESDDTRHTNGFVCGKLISRSLFSNVEFPLGYWFEDTIYCMILEPMCKRIASVAPLVFGYRMRRNSISHSFAGKPKAIDNLYITLGLLRDRENLGIAFDQRQYDMMLHQMFMNTWCVMGLPEEVARAVFVVQRDLIAVRLGKWHTSDIRLRNIERLIRENNFQGYMLWCKWHEC